MRASCLERSAPPLLRKSDRFRHETENFKHYLAATRQRVFDFSFDVRVLNEPGRTRYERSRQLRGKQFSQNLVEDTSGL